MTRKHNLSRKDQAGNDVCGAVRTEERKTCRNYVERVGDKIAVCNNLMLGRFCRANPEAAAKWAETAKTAMQTFQDALARSRKAREK